MLDKDNGGNNNSDEDDFVMVDTADKVRDLIGLLSAITDVLQIDAEHAQCKRSRVCSSGGYLDEVDSLYEKVCLNVMQPITI